MTLQSGSALRTASIWEGLKRACLVGGFEVHGVSGRADVEDVGVASGEAELAGRVAGQILVGEEQHAVTLPEGPVHHLFRVGGGAHRAAVASHHGLDRQRGVDVGERHQMAPGGGEALQHPVEQGGGGHLRHDAVRAVIGQEHLLAFAGEQGGGFRHEVDAAENDEIGIDAGNAPGEFEGVAADVAVPDGFFLFVMVPHDGQPAAERGAKFLDAGGIVLGVHAVSLAMRMLRSAVTAECVMRPTEMKSGLRKLLTVA